MAPFSSISRGRADGAAAEAFFQFSQTQTQEEVSDLIKAQGFSKTDMLHGIVDASLHGPASARLRHQNHSARFP